MAKAPALVLSSGGLHSLVTAAIAAREYRVALLHLSDGRASAIQAKAALDRQIEHFKPLKSWIVDASYFRQMSLPPETAGLVSATGSDAQANLIPLRELQILSLAAGFARQLHSPLIFWGMQLEQKHADAIAKTVELVQVMNQMIEVLSPEMTLVVKTPLLGLEDQQVIELGHQMGVPFGASWTCQMNIESPCMSCPACARRIRSFRAAQLADPLIARKMAAAY